MDLPTGAHRSDSFPKVQLQAVIADWAGTTVDYGSRAPAMVFVEIFRRKGIEEHLPEQLHQFCLPVETVSGRRRTSTGDNRVPCFRRGEEVPTIGQPLTKNRRMIIMIE